MKTAATLVLAVLLAAPSRAEPVGTRTSLTQNFSVTIDSFAYAVTSLATFLRTARGIQVSTGQAGMFATQQPAGPQNNASFQEIFTIPSDVLDLYY